MSKLGTDLKTMCMRNKDGSEATQAARFLTLQQCARQLRSCGYNNIRAPNLTMKHVMCLLRQWQQAGLSAGTIKNRMAHLRWLAEKVDKPGMIPKDNAELGIADRQYAGTPNKAQVLDDKRLARITDPYTAMSLRLQALFGLRREESIKIVMAKAAQGNMLYLDGPWCKGGRPRIDPIRTAAQRAGVRDCLAFAGDGALIPPGKSYIQQRNTYDGQCKAAGLKNTHGLRHQYAQTRYEELTNWKCPKAGGPARDTLKGEDQETDRMARLTISKELGHCRIGIVATYCG